MKPETTPREQRSRETFFALVGPHVKRLYHFVRHLLAYREAIGDLRAGELSADDVVDAVLVRAYQEFITHPPPRKLKSWLIGLAREQLAADVRRLKAWHERTPVHTEDDVPETPPEESVSRLGEEVLDFDEPDEDLKVEDVVADLDLTTPEEQAATDELRWCVASALAGLPLEWREILLLRHVEGLSGAELARVSGRPALEVERVLDQARQYLRQRLVESGCALEGSSRDGRAA
jgi:RNA polymerase sigma factor (sigma-70 family)